MTTLRKLWQKLAGPLLLFVICVGFYWKLVLTDQYTWLAGSDLTNQVLPWFEVQAGQWHAGRLPLWDPYQWAGQPLLAQGQPGAAYPLNWILLNLPLSSSGWIRQSFLHWYFVLIHYMAALFCYWLCRDLGRSRAAAVIGGSIFALGGYVGTTDWPQMLNGAIWAPLVLMFVLRSLRGERPLSSAALGGTFLGIAWLSGHHQIPIFIALTCAGLWLYRIWISRRDVIYAGTFYIFMAAVSALQTLPAYEYGKLALRWVNASAPVGWGDAVPYSVHRFFSFNPLGIIGVVIPALNTNADGFLGITAASLGLLGALACRRDRTVRLLIAVAAVGLLFSLGGSTMFHGFLYAVLPLVEKARSPSMAILIFHLAAAPLIAFGVDALAANSTWTRRISIGLVVLGSAMLTFLLVLNVAAGRAFEDRIVLVGLVALACSAIVVASRDGAIPILTASGSLLALSLIEFSNVSTYALPHLEDHAIRENFKKLSHNADLVRFVRSLPRPMRLEIADSSLSFNLGDFHGIELMGGQVPSVTQNILNAGDRRDVGYVIAKKPTRPGQKDLFTASSGLKVFRNPEVSARTWVESERCSEPGYADILRHVPDRVLIHARLPCPGTVVLADTYYPGWRATVDGRPAVISEVHGAFRGIAAGTGVHLIEFRYRPAMVYLGAGLTALGLCGALILRFASSA